MFGVNHPKQRTVHRRDEEECRQAGPGEEMLLRPTMMALRLKMLQSQRKTIERGSWMQRRRLQDVGDAAETR